MIKVTVTPRANGQIANECAAVIDAAHRTINITAKRCEIDRDELMRYVEERCRSMAATDPVASQGMN